MQASWATRACGDERVRLGSQDWDGPHVGALGMQSTNLPTVCFGKMPHKDIEIYLLSKLPTT